MQDGTISSLGHPQVTEPGSHPVFPSDCPIRQLLDRIGDKWSVLALLVLGDTAMRFGELRRCIGGVSQKVLTQTLRSLERDGLLTRLAEPTVPVSVTYSLTPLGIDLLSALRLMMEWAETRMALVKAAQSEYDQRGLR